MYDTVCSSAHRLPHRLTAPVLGLVALLAMTGAAIAGPITTDYTSWANDAVGNRTKVTFDDRAAWTTLSGNEYAGLQIANRDNGSLVVVTINSGTFLEPGNFNSPSNGLSSSWATNKSFTNASDNLDFVFTSPAASAGLWIGNLSYQATTVQFLGENYHVLDSIPLTTSTGGHVGNDYTGRIFVGLNATTASIVRIRVINEANDNDGITFDDVEFGPTTVTSVPNSGSSLLLLGMAMLSLGRARLPRR